MGALAVAVENRRMQSANRLASRWRSGHVVANRTLHPFLGYFRVTVYALNAVSHPIKRIRAIVRLATRNVGLGGKSAIEASVENDPVDRCPLHRFGAAGLG